MKILIIFLATTLLISCKKKCLDDCPGGDFGLKFSIIDTQTRKSLLSGPNRRFNIDSIKLEDLTNHKIVLMQPFLISASKDSGVLIATYTCDEFILHYSGIEQDTFNVIRETIPKTDCCEEYTLRKFLNRSKSNTMKNDYGIFIIEK